MKSNCDIFKNRYFIFLIAGLFSVVMSLIQLKIPEKNLYFSCFMSIINVILCYGIVSVFFLKKRKSSYFEFDIKDVLLAVVLGVFTVFICYFFQNAFFNFLYAITGYIPEKYITLVENIIFEENYYSVIERVILVFSFGIITPFFEELFFRFVMLENYEENSLILRMIMVNLCFILMHDDTDLLIFITPLSIVCCWLMHSMRCFLYPFFAHAIVNVVGIMELPIDEVAFSPRYAIEYNEKQTALINGIFNIVLMAFFVFLINLITKRRAKNSKANWINSDIKENVKYFISVLCYLLLQCFA